MAGKFFFFGLFAGIVLCANLACADQVRFVNVWNADYTVKLTPLVRRSTTQQYIIGAGQTASIPVDFGLKYDIELVDPRGLTYFRRAHDFSRYQSLGQGTAVALSEVFTLRGAYLACWDAFGNPTVNYHWLAQSVDVPFMLSVDQNGSSFVPVFPQFDLAMVTTVVSSASGYGASNNNATSNQYRRSRRR